MIYAQEEFVNETKGYRCGSSDVYETFTDDRGELFRAMQREYGRCVSAVYVDQKAGGAKAIGWVFQKRVEYDRSNETFLQEVWATLHEAPPTKTIEYHYA